MEFLVRPVQPGDLRHLTHLVHASRGLEGAALDELVEREVARFQKQGMVEMIESNTLVALDGERFAGMLRYGEFENELQLLRPDVDPRYDQRAVAKALLTDIWSFVRQEMTHATYVDYPMHSSTLGDVFEEAGFSLWLERFDMRLKLREQVAPRGTGLQFFSFTEAVKARFYQVYAASFAGSLDPMMKWCVDHPVESFEMFQTRYGPVDPELWFLASDADGQDVGIAMFQQITSGRYAGDTLLMYTAVAEHARGKGYGGEIVREGLRRVRDKQGPAHAVSLSVTRTNAPAANIYAGIGFRRTEEFNVYKRDRE